MVDEQAHAYKTFSNLDIFGEIDVIYKIYMHCLLSMQIVRRHLVGALYP